MKSLGDDSLPIDVTKDEKQQDAVQAVKQFSGRGFFFFFLNIFIYFGTVKIIQTDISYQKKHFFLAPMVEEDNISPQHGTPVESGFSEKFSPDNIDLVKAPVHAG